MPFKQPGFWALNLEPPCPALPWMMDGQGGKTGFWNFLGGMEMTGMTWRAEVKCSLSGKGPAATSAAIPKWTMGLPCLGGLATCRRRAISGCRERADPCVAICASSPTSMPSFGDAVRVYYDILIERERAVSGSWSGRVSPFVRRCHSTCFMQSWQYGRTGRFVKDGLFEMFEIQVCCVQWDPRVVDVLPTAREMNGREDQSLDICLCKQGPRFLFLSPTPFTPDSRGVLVSVPAGLGPWRNLLCC
jgi:hypothetical protein